jgi:threonine/homoserine/homoserine lactone efflux protein
VTAAIGAVLPIAVGTLLSSLPVVAIALMIVAGRSGLADVAFLAGWLAGLATVGAIVILFADSVLGSGSQPRWASVLRIVLGVLLLLLAVKQWRGRPEPGAPPKTPSWMSSIDAITPSRAFGLGYLLGSVNPKNLVLVVSGATAIVAATTVVREQVTAFLVFVVIASAGVAAPAVIARVLGSRSTKVLDGARTWMTAHSATVLTVVLAALGAMLISNGVGGLA